jgi:UDP-N-acetylmuramate dehydrogenase
MERAVFAGRLLDLAGPLHVRPRAPLAPLTTFRVGGPAEWLVDVRTIEMLVAVVGLAREAGVPLTVLGGGSNVLVADAGITGVVLRLKLVEMARTAEGHVRADAGVTINGLVRWTVGRGLAGVEAWAGTPGTVGGAIHGNAHWSGTNIGDLVARVTLVSRQGDVSTVERDAMAFAYDTSRVQTTGDIVTSAEFVVRPGDPGALRERARASLAYRKRTQPLAMASAGCIFQNPDPSRDVVPGEIPASAGALVDRAGLKGRRVGGAVISDRHGNFIVNEGQATAKDIRELIEAARAGVLERFGVALRDEVAFLGNF